MRIWDINPKKLCGKHLLGEHRELHALWSILANNKKGYRNHPETQRWIGKRKALYLRHEELVKEFQRRGYNHSSPLDERKASGSSIQELFIDTIAEQRMILTYKNCDCLL